jgi:23S rRNA (uracil1939-C5)-methyltransferase
MALSLGARITIDAERPVAGGRMLARHERQVVFVAGAIPGERITARVTRVARGTVYADTVEVVTASPDRRPGVDGRCGGSILGHVDYQRQVALKAAIIEDAWRHIARLPVIEPVRVLASPERGYRSRARLHAGEGRLGFFREGTHQLCDPAATGQLSESTLTWVRQAEAMLSIDAARALVAVDLVENAAGTERACHLHVRPGVLPAVFEPLAAGLTGLSVGSGAAGVDEDSENRVPDRGVVVVAGDPSVTDVIELSPTGGPAQVSLRHGARAFFQGNRFLLTPLVQTVVDATEGSVLDLFAGTGLFGLALAATGHSPVTMVEGDPVSGRDLAFNAAASAAGASVNSVSVEAYLARPRTAFVTWVVDPPRTGLPEAVRAAVLRDRPARIVYVSCDPATLARDVRALVQGGYEVRSLTGLDMFPSTAHVEAVCVLDGG